MLIIAVGRSAARQTPAVAVRQRLPLRRRRARADDATNEKRPCNRGVDAARPSKATAA